MPQLQGSSLHEGVSRRGAHPAVHHRRARRQDGRRGKDGAFGQQSPRRLRQGVSAGKPMRKVLHPPREAGRIGRHRRARTLCRGLRGSARHQARGKACGKCESRGGGERSRITFLCGGSCQSRRESDHVRGFAQGGRRAGLRHPGVPSPQGHRRARSGEPERHGRHRAHRHGGGQDGHARRAACGI